MNKELQPEFKETTVTCACGNVFKTASVKENLKVEICSECHPHWTGAKRANQRSGREAKFKAKYGL